MRAATSISLKVALTPTLMFGAKTMAMRFDAASIARLPAASKPVVPMTIFTPCAAQASRCRSVASGRVKSISTSAPASAPSSPLTRTPVTFPIASPQSRPSTGLSARSSAAAKARSGWPSVASISIRPMRPDAPAIAIFIGIVSRPVGAESVRAGARSRCRDIGHRDLWLAVHARNALDIRAQDQRVDVVFARHRVVFKTIELAVLEEQRQAPVLDLTAARVQVIDVVDPVLVKFARQQRRPEHEADLVTRHAYPQLIHHLLRDDVALVDIRPVRAQERRRPRCGRRDARANACTDAIERLATRQEEGGGADGHAARKHRSDLPT